MPRLLTISLASLAVAFCALVLSPARAAEDSTEKAKAPITGVLIDNACGAKQMSKDDPQAAAAKHPKACCLKEACAASGFAVISGKHLYKFDDKGNELAMEYLKKSDTKTMVVVDGQVKDDGTIAVTEIKPAEEKKG